MHIQSSLLLLSFLSFSFLFTIQGFEPSPAPISGDGVASSPPLPELAQSPAPVRVEESQEVDGAPEPVPEKERGEVPAVAAEEEGLNLKAVRWCTVRAEYEDCQDFMSSLKEVNGSSWKCINKDTTQQCLESIRNGEADLISLEAGMAYTAFTTYSMKAIANEVYCDQAVSYDAVAIVHRRACKEKENISLQDFKGSKSCHGGYSTAAGWNYPINHIKKQFVSDEMSAREIAASFFSKVCAPSELGEDGICSGCGNENGTCVTDSNRLYYGNTGAFRCLVEELGDIAFVKSDTALLYSMEGPYNQSWSTKSVRDFMYLCPDGGCREINGYPGSCFYGTVPANVIMASNSIPNDKRLFILQTLTNAIWRDALHYRKISSSQLLSPSTQQLAVVKKLTRSYLGQSALVSQSIQNLNTPNVQSIPSAINSDSEVSSNSCLKHPLAITYFAAVTVLMLILS